MKITLERNIPKVETEGNCVAELLQNDLILRGSWIWILHLAEHWNTLFENHAFGTKQICTAQVKKSGQSKVGPFQEIVYKLTNNQISTIPIASFI